MAARIVPKWMKRVGRIALSSDARQNALHEWSRNRRGEPQLPPGAIERVLVLCHGNICRSPFAAALLASRRPELQVRSAGFFAKEGSPAEEEARRAARAFGIDLETHAARPIAERDLEWADLILGMEGHHAARIARHWPANLPRTRLIGDYLFESPYAIADPWGQSDEFFRLTFTRISEAVTRLLKLAGPFPE
jgi:protein-tyrosine phosphatase